MQFARGFKAAKARGFCAVYDYFLAWPGRGEASVTAMLYRCWKAGLISKTDQLAYARMWWNKSQFREKCAPPPPPPPEPPDPPELPSPEPHVDMVSTIIDAVSDHGCRQITLADIIARSGQLIEAIIDWLWSLLKRARHKPDNTTSIAENARDVPSTFSQDLPTLFWESVHPPCDDDCPHRPQGASAEEPLRKAFLELSHGFRSASRGDMSAAIASAASVLKLMGQFAGQRLASFDVQTGRGWLDFLRQLLGSGWPGLRVALPGLGGLLTILLGLISLKVLLAIALALALAIELINIIGRSRRRSPECNPPPDRIADSGALGANLEVGPDRDVPRITVSPTGAVAQAHHIVPGGHRRAVLARRILYSYPVCIGINDAINGIFLPVTSGKKAPRSSNPLNRVFHNETFTPRYAEYVEQQLTPASGSRTMVRAVLRQLRTEMASGIINW